MTNILPFRRPTSRDVLPRTPIDPIREPLWMELTCTCLTAAIVMTTAAMWAIRLA